MEKDEEFGEIEYHFDVQNYGQLVTLAISSDKPLDKENYLSMLQGLVDELWKDEGDFILDAPHKGLN